METSDNGQNPQVVTPDIAVVEAAVKQAVSHIEDIYQLLPDFAPTNADGLKGMPARSVSDEFLEACAFAAEKDPTLQARTGLDPVKARLVIARNLRYDTLHAVAEALVRDIRYNMLRDRWDVVQQALQVYSITKGFTRNERADAALAHVRKMKAAIGRNGKRGKLKTAPDPQTVSQKQ